MLVDLYYGQYADFKTVSKKEAAKLLSADSMIGDCMTIDCEMTGDEHRAWLINPLGECVGYLDAAMSRQMSLEKAKGMQLCAVLSFLAFTDSSDDGYYWGEVALICYSPAYEDCFSAFVHNVADRMGRGQRTPVDLGPDAITRIIASDGTWFPEQTLPLPEKAKGTAIIKSRRTLNDKLISQGRAGNKGCYIVSWIFLLVLVAAIIFGLKSCFF
jgi:hypothetical protein